MSADSFKNNQGRFSNIPKEELKEIQKRGGKRSGIVRKERAILRKSFDRFLSLRPTNEEICSVTDRLEGFESVTYADLIALRCILQLVHGEIDIRLLEFLRDTIGEKPTNTVTADLGLEQGAEVVVTLPDNQRD